MELLSHFLDSTTQDDNAIRGPSQYHTGRNNPDLITAPMIQRYRNAQAHNMYDDVDLQSFRDIMLGAKLAKCLNWNYRNLLSRPSRIASWRVPHESDMVDLESQEVQSFPHYLALRSGVGKGNRDKILLRDNAFVGRYPLPSVPTGGTVGQSYPPPPPPPSLPRMKNGIIPWTYHRMMMIKEDN